MHVTVTITKNVLLQKPKLTDSIDRVAPLLLMVKIPGAESHQRVHENGGQVRSFDPRFLNKEVSNDRKHSMFRRLKESRHLRQFALRQEQLIRAFAHFYSQCQIQRTRGRHSSV